MPDETRAIEPALSAAEWKALCARHEVGDGYVYEVALRGDHIAAVREYTTRYEGHATRDLSAAHQVLFAPLMALANAALPDGDPRKITRDDVYALLNFDLLDAPKTERYLERIAAKLAALLPPEG